MFVDAIENDASVEVTLHERDPRDKTANTRVRMISLGFAAKPR